MKLARRCVAFAALALAAAAIGLAPGCSTRICELADGSTYQCTTDDECDHPELDGKAPLCRESPRASSGYKCTRACTDSTDCECACAERPDRGYCFSGTTASTLDSSSRSWVCAADKPSIATMCDLVLDAENACCSISGTDVEWCKVIEEKHPTCKDELEAFFFCAMRLATLCEGDGAFAPETCLKEADAASACTLESFSNLHPKAC